MSGLAPGEPLGSLLDLDRQAIPPGRCNSAPTAKSFGFSNGSPPDSSQFLGSGSSSSEDPRTAMTQFPYWSLREIDMQSAFPGHRKWLSGFPPNRNWSGAGLFGRKQSVPAPERIKGQHPSTARMRGI
jgi:hypothetical protein